MSWRMKAACLVVGMLTVSALLYLRSIHPLLGFAAAVTLVGGGLAPYLLRYRRITREKRQAAIARPEDT